ncbi:hypothetical protein AUJ42_00770 [Candidatus Collierbacteria bacterium CG1_02_44_10]|uniref:Uncharacterized protein n=1 Tax=Candidatus Collierbacteria bacterium CG1_02_44_10 TaxID=1805087 RepID=A0A1J4S0J2_9BACT|nr:MAG: hypothetical protein AUJ42_00770 [Candidatus Collierbacteria bacterium CG1_02_44_10]
MLETTVQDKRVIDRKSRVAQRVNLFFLPIFGSDRFLRQGARTRKRASHFFKHLKRLEDMRAQDLKEFNSPDQTAFFYGISRATLDRYVKNNPEFPKPIKFSARKLAFKKADLLKFANIEA